MSWIFVRENIAPRLTESLTALVAACFLFPTHLIHISIRRLLHLLRRVTGFEVTRES